METRKHHLIIIALLLSIIFFRADYLFAEDKKLSILRVSPAGEDVPLDRQIVVQFNRPVVPVGRMERRPEEVAVRIDPPLECEWRWLNTSSLACQLAEKNSMTPATRYELIIAAGFNAADGAALENEYKHSFLTARPKVTYAWINNWQSANEPLISINFDQLVEKKSLERHLFLFDPVLNKRYSLKVELGKYSKGDRWNISAGDALPADTDIKLMIEAGVLGSNGKKPGDE